jgi:hypothetical protein
MTDTQSAEPAPKAEQKSSLLGEALLLAAIPALAYWFSYGWQKGRASYFGGFPLDPVLTPASAFGVLVPAMLAILAGFVCLPWLEPIGGRARVPMAVKLATVTFGVGVLAAVIAPESIVGFLLLPLYAGFGGLIILYAVLRTKDGRTFREKLEKSDEGIFKPTATHPGLFVRLGFNAVGLMILLSSVVWLACYLHGKDSARSQVHYLIPATHPEFVVVQESGDSALCMRLDRATKTVRPQFLRLKLGEGPGTVLTREKVGPLAFRDEVPPSTQPASPPAAP